MEIQSNSLLESVRWNEQIVGFYKFNEDRLSMTKKMKIIVPDTLNSPEVIMKTKILLPLLIMLFLSGCFNFDIDLSDIALKMDFLPGVSLHRLYTEDEVIFDENLLGSWGEEEEENKFVLRFEKADDADAYNLTVNIDKMTGQFIAHLVKIEKMLFLDVVPQKRDFLSRELHQHLLVSAHLFVKIEQIQPTLRLRIIDADKIEEMLENDPNLLKHEFLEDIHVVTKKSETEKMKLAVKENSLLLTASTIQLQEFMKKHADDKDLFDEQPELSRIKSKASDTNNQPDPDSMSADKAPVEFSVSQRSTTPLPRSDGKLILTLDDITRGQVLVTISWQDGRTVIATRSLRQNDIVTFTANNKTYKLKLQRLTNVLIGDDSAVFQLWPVASETEVLLSEQDRIEKMISSLQQLSDCKFIRNGKEYTIDEAVTHIKRKWEWKKSEIKTAEDFITIAGSKSSESGEPYLIKQPDGKVLKLDEWFRKQLDLMKRINDKNQRR